MSMLCPRFSSTKRSKRGRNLRRLGSPIETLLEGDSSGQMQEAIAMLGRGVQVAKEMTGVRKDGSRRGRCGTVFTLTFPHSTS